MVRKNLQNKIPMLAKQYTRDDMMIGGDDADGDGIHDFDISDRLLSATATAAAAGSRPAAAVPSAGAPGTVPEIGVTEETILAERVRGMCCSSSIALKEFLAANPKSKPLMI